MNSPRRNNFVLRSVLISCIVAKLQKPSSSRLKPRTVFCVVALFLQSPLRNKQLWLWCPSTIVFSFRATETIFAGNRTQEDFRSCGLSFCNFLFETNSSGLGAVLLSCLVSELQKSPSSRIELRIFSGVLTPYVLFLVSKNTHAKFGAHRFIPSRAISEHKNINIHTHNFHFNILRWKDLVKTNTYD
jgi:hypothetical protein